MTTRMLVISVFIPRENACTVLLNLCGEIEAAIALLTDPSCAEGLGRKPGNKGVRLPRK